LKNEYAQSLALRALAALANDEELKGRFLSASGLNSDNITDRAQDPEFLGFVLDFLMEGDDVLLSIAATLGESPEVFVEARAHLPGGDTPHWT